MKRWTVRCVVALFLCTVFQLSAQQSLNDWAASLSEGYLLYPDQQYSYASGTSLKLDVWQAQTKEPVPTVIYYHGGGWFFGDRTGAVPFMMPWLARGWNVINVEYRMSGTALAPAAVEDARCALRWVYRNAKQFHLNTNQIIVTGHSAGGHLALMAGMLRDADGLDNDCPADPSMGEPEMKVAAIVDWYGPTDVADLLSGPNRKTYAVAWLGSLTDRAEQAKRVSPLQYVHAGLPPVFIVHGSQDPVVPYAQSVRLHELLDANRIPNQLFTVPNGKHGFFGPQNEIAAYHAMWDFLEANLPALPRRVTSPHPQ